MSVYFRPIVSLERMRSRTKALGHGTWRPLRARSKTAGRVAGALGAIRGPS